MVAKPKAQDTKKGQLPRAVAYGMALMTGAVLVLQIAITRIMSSTVSHHSAFMVLAVVMLGLAASAIAAYRDIKKTAHWSTAINVTVAARRAALATALAPIIFAQSASFISGVGFEGLNIVLAGVLFYFAFFFSGYVVASLLTHFAVSISRLYWFDLLGAALGCLAAVPLLDTMSAFNVVLLCSVVMAVTSTILAASLQGGRHAGLTLAILLCVLWLFGLWYPWLSRPFHEVTKNQLLIWEGWNSLAKVSVFSEAPNLDEAVREYRRVSRQKAIDTERVKRRWASGWGTSQVYDGEVAPLLWMELDSGASTQIIGKAKAAAGDLDFLKWDVTAAAYWLLPQGQRRAFIIGGGGGRDVMTAEQFGFSDIDVVELNPAVIHAVQEKFGDFSGRPYSLPNVHLSIDEARSYLSRRPQEYDLIQMSMVDTFAASVAGSLVLTEQNLYTVEAFELFIKRLTEDGILSVSRWYNIHHFAELGRVIRLMAEALRNQGVDRPEDHIAVVYNQGHLQASVVNCILKKSPFNGSALEIVKDLNERMKFTVLWPEIKDVTKYEVLDVKSLVAPKLVAKHPVGFDLSPPTDDRPFFFNYSHPIDSLLEAIRTADSSRVSPFTIILGQLLVLLSLATAVIVVRLRRYEASIPINERVSLRYNWPAILYFGGIGFGFMLIELALIQRYILFLGHPTYAITLVLFALLLFSGIGSSLTRRVANGSSLQAARWALIGVILGAVGTAFVIPGILEMAYHWSSGMRIIVAGSLIAPVATCMGMIFPLGARILRESSNERSIAYMWGVNGIAAVFASIVGMGIAVSYGYTVLFLAAIGSYLVTLTAVNQLGRVWIGRREYL